MGILPAEFGNETNAQKEVELQRKAFMNIFMGLSVQAKQLFARTWNNPKITAREIMQEWGTDGKFLFDIFTQLQEFLYAIAKESNQVYEPLVPPFSYTENADGSIDVDMNTPNPNLNQVP